MPSIEITTPNVHFPHVRRCIYCRRKFGLTKEHVIPFGLAGNSLVLHSASCRKCQDLTRDFETVCLRHMWLPFRTKLLIPSREKSGRPTEFKVQRGRMDDIRQGVPPRPTHVDTVSTEAYPLFLYMFTFLAPGILSGRPAHEDKDDAMMLFDREAAHRVVGGSGFAMKLGTANWVPFCRMLAKIGHAYAVARLGIDAFKPALTLGIRGKDTVRWLYWIGSEPAVRSSPVSLHEIACRLVEIRGRKCVAVELRLFASLETPKYTVIVGELEPRFDKFSLLEQPVHEILVKVPLPTEKLVPAMSIHNLPAAEKLSLLKDEPGQRGTNG